MVDPNILLQAQPAQTMTPLEAFAQAQQAKGLMQEQQLRGQQITAVDQQNQMRAQQLRDTQAIRQAWLSANGDLTKVPQMALQNGASPKAILDLQNSVIAHQTSLATLDKDELANRLTKNNALAGLLDPVVEEPDPAKQAQAYQQAVERAVNQGWLAPGQAPAYSGPDALKAYQASLFTNDQLIKGAQAKAAETRAAAAATQAQTAQQRQANAAPGQQAQSAQQVRANLSAQAANVFTSGGPDGFAKWKAANDPGNLLPQYQAGTRPADFVAQLRQFGMTPEQQVTTEQTAARNKATAAFQQAEIAARNTANQIARDRLSGNIQLSAADEAVAQKLATGDLDPTRLSRMQNKQAIMARAIQLNPNWSSQTYLTKKDFLDPKGKESTNLTTIARIVGHIGRFEQNSGKLGFAPVYGMGNITIGGTASALDADSHAIAGELEKLVSGGVGSQTEIDAWKHDLRSSFPGVRQKAVDEISQLIGSQYEGMAQQYRAGTGEELPVARYLTPQAQQWMRSKGIQVATSGQTPAARPAAAQAPAMQIGQRVTLRGGKTITITAVHPDGSFDGK